MAGSIRKRQKKTIIADSLYSLFMADPGTVL
jgi:hypothetical protein